MIVSQVRLQVPARHRVHGVTAAH